MKSKIEILGIDIGRTIVDTSIKPRGPFPDAFRVIKRLVDERFGSQHTFIVSRVNEEQKVRAQKWLEQSGFHEKTGVPVNHVEFCLERRDKAPICQRLGVTHFIDDQPEVHFHLRGIVPYRFLFRGIDEYVERFHSRNGDITRVFEWKEIEKLLLP